MAHYQLCILGDADWRFEELTNSLRVACSNLGLSEGSLEIVDEGRVSERDRKLPTVGIFFGYQGARGEDHPTLPDLIRDSTTIITVVSDLSNARAEVPLALAHINALPLSIANPSVERMTSLVLESFRLLRRERRLFISYKRLDSESLAGRLYEELDKRGFDVFIDTRSVPPGVDFQDELWHRLADSDVVVLIDTPNFRSSRWTTEELAKANATNIQILHVLWPGQLPDADSAFSEFFELTEDSFVGTPGLGGFSTIKPEVLNAICEAAEHLRARAMAARYRYLVDGFCDLARDASVDAVVQPERWILVRLPDGSELAVVPAIGVPTSKRINEIFDEITGLRSEACTIWLLYDNRGLLGSWLRHLDWLDMHLPVKNIRASAAADYLAGAIAC